MIDDETRLESRLRGIFRGVDTRADFEARVLAHVRALPGATVTDIRERHERHRERLRRRLRREAGSNLATVAAIGGAAAAIVWQHAGEIMLWARAGGAADLHPWLLAGGTLLAFGAAIWPFRRRFAPAAL